MRVLGLALCLGLCGPVDAKVLQQGATIGQLRAGAYCWKEADGQRAAPNTAAGATDEFDVPPDFVLLGDVSPDFVFLGDEVPWSAEVGLGIRVALPDLRPADHLQAEIWKTGQKAPHDRFLTQVDADGTVFIGLQGDSLGLLEGQYRFQLARAGVVLVSYELRFAKRFGTLSCDRPVA